MSTTSQPTDEHQRGRRDGMLEAAAWLDDCAGYHVRSSEVWSYLSGSADFMRQRAEEIARRIDRLFPEDAP